MKLHLGCGNAILPGFVNVDAVAGPGVDVVDDVQELATFPHECADLIYASHVLDHMDRAAVPEVLAAWRRRLRPGGTLRLAVSDFEAVVACYNDGMPLSRLLGHIVGGHKNAYDRHGVVFDVTTLSAALTEAGFINVRTWDWQAVDHGTYDDFSQAYEPHMDKTAGKLMSLNLEAEVQVERSKPPQAWVFGDSHSVVFGGGRVHPKHLDCQRPFFDCRGYFGVCYAGPWLAWRMGDQDRTDEAMRLLKDMHHAAERPVIFTLGEIDCRTRLAVEGFPGGVREAASRYVGFLVAVRTRFNVPVAAYDPPPPTPGPIYNPEFPARGSYRERRAASDEFSRVLQQRCQAYNLGFISIRDRLVDGPERTNLHCFSDSIHLNPDKTYDAIREETEKWITSL